MADDRSIADELQKLYELKEKGVITEVEFNEQKTILLLNTKERSSNESKPAEPVRVRTPSSRDQPTIVITQINESGFSRFLAFLGRTVRRAMVIWGLFILLVIGAYFWSSSH